MDELRGATGVFCPGEPTDDSFGRASKASTLVPRVPRDLKLAPRSAAPSACGARRCIRIRSGITASPRCSYRPMEPAATPASVVVGSQPAFRDRVAVA